MYLLRLSVIPLLPSLLTSSATTTGHLAIVPWAIPLHALILIFLSTMASVLLYAVPRKQLLLLVSRT
jgi:hypothetical protein